ncbi:MAG: TolC family protein [Flavobacteriales bacterium]|nr:TolC family protein [Flavobacteriales bacterium]
MKGSISYLIAVIALCCAIQGSAQNKEWSLQQCIEYALEHNLNIQQGKLNVLSSEHNSLQGKEAILPTVSGFAGNNYNFGRNINPLDNTYVKQRVQSNNFGLSSQLTLFNGLSIYNNIRLNSLNEEASRKDLEVISNSIVLQIATQYLQILLNKEAISVVKSRITSSEKQLETANIQFDAGNANKSSILEMEAKLSSDKLDLVMAENNLTLSQLSLANLLQIPDIESFNVSDPEIGIPDEIILEGATSIYDKATKIMPEIELSILRYKASLMQENISRSGYFPTLSLSGNINTLYSDNFKRLSQQGTIETIPFSTQINNNLGQSIGINLSVPIYSRGRVRNSVKQAKLGTEQQKLNVRKAENDLYTSVVNAVANYKAAKSKYGALTEAYASQLKNYEFNQLRYETGSLNATDLLLSKNNLEVSESNLIQGKYDLIFRKILLDFYRGKPISIN